MFSAQSVLLRSDIAVNLFALAPDNFVLLESLLTLYCGSRPLSAMA